MLQSLARGCGKGEIPLTSRSSLSPRLNAEAPGLALLLPDLRRVSLCSQRVAVARPAKLNTRSANQRRLCRKHMLRCYLVFTSCLPLAHQTKYLPSSKQEFCAVFGLQVFFFVFFCSCRLIKKTEKAADSSECNEIPSFHRGRL